MKAFLWGCWSGFRKEDKTMALHETLHEFKSSLLCLGATSNNRSSNTDSSPNRIIRRDEDAIIEIRSPLRVTRKGRPQTKRKWSVVEKVVQRSRKRTKKKGDRLTTKARDYFHNICIKILQSYPYVKRWLIFWWNVYRILCKLFCLNVNGCYLVNECDYLVI